MYDRIQYDLVRIAYDVETDKWGQIEIVLSASQTGKSIGMPRVSPDGRWLTFCLMDYGYFPTWKQESDLYVMDLQAPPQGGQFAFRPLDVNSDKSESWLTWSSNSRWIVFSSKRLHDVFTRLFISYVDADGKAYKPLLLPQEDPDFYESCLELFNTPELVIGPPPAAGETLAKVFRSRDGTTVSIPATMATPIARPAGSTRASWQTPARVTPADGFYCAHEGDACVAPTRGNLHRTHVWPEGGNGLDDGSFAGYPAEMVRDAYHGGVCVEMRGQRTHPRFGRGNRAIDSGGVIWVR